MATTKPPTTEQGSVSNIGGVVGVPGWNMLIDETEWAQDLMWPLSIKVYDQMLADSQAKGLWMGVVLPLTKYQWKLDKNGSRAEVYTKISKDYQLPIVGQEDNPPKTRRSGFRHAKHLPQALRALVYGHYPFEQVGEYQDDGYWHLTKLAERPPRTLSEINILPDGGLNFIKQAVGPNSPSIPVNRLVYYVWDKEGGNWYGKSFFRAIFRNWLVKDKLIRVDAMKHERNGMGVPWFEAPPGASNDQIKALEEIAEAWKVGEDSGGAGPAGTKPSLIGTTGTLPDTIASIRYHDEQMAVNFMAQFGELGRASSGSYALGQTLFDHYTTGLDGIADWHCDTFTEYMIEDDVAWNWGPDEQAPQLVYERDEEAVLALLAGLVEKKIITVDTDVENVVRKRIGLPEKEKPTTPPPPPPPGTDPALDPNALDPNAVDPSQTPATPVAGARRSGVQAEVEAPSPPLSLPARKLRRQPYEHEVRASVDFAAMDSAFSLGVDMLVADVQNIQRTQIQQIHDAIVGAKGDMDKLAALMPEPAAEDAILARMQVVADHGIDLAVGEATRQGVESVKIPKLPEIEDSLAARARAVDQILARSLGESASRKALSLTGGALRPADVAANVAVYLDGLTGSYLKDQLGGTLNQAMNTGRKVVMDQNSPSDIYSSELLDEATCENCVAKDGTNYKTLDDAESDYPTGGYSDCLGGPRCRGTLVAVYETETPATMES